MTTSTERAPLPAPLPTERALAVAAVTAFRTAAATARPRPRRSQVRATAIAAQILEVAPPGAPVPAVPTAPPDYVPKAHLPRRRRRG